MKACLSEPPFARWRASAASLYIPAPTPAVAPGGVGVRNIGSAIDPGFSASRVTLPPITKGPLGVQRSAGRRDFRRPLVRSHTATHPGSPSDGPRTVTAVCPTEMNGPALSRMPPPIRSA